MGCGHGAAVTLVCEQLAGGTITAIDRSAKMIAMARERNRDCAARVRFLEGPVEAAGLAESAYDTAFAVHVAALERPGPALDAVRDALVLGGRLALFSQSPRWRDEREPRRFAEQLSAILEAAGFIPDRTLVGATRPAPSAGVIVAQGGVGRRAANRKGRVIWAIPRFRAHGATLGRTAVRSARVPGRPGGAVGAGRRSARAALPLILRRIVRSWRDRRGAELYRHQP